MQRIVHIADELQEFVTDVDGFVKWWPKDAGCLNAHDLRALADELERRNASWAAQIDEFFAKQGQG